MKNCSQLRITEIIDWWTIPFFLVQLVRRIKEIEDKLSSVLEYREKLKALVSLREYNTSAFALGCLLGPQHAHTSYFIGYGILASSVWLKSLNPTALKM
jgi:hypothetical protein